MKTTINIYQADKWRTVEGYILKRKFMGQELAVHRCLTYGKKWVVTDVLTGHKVTQAQSTKRRAQAVAWRRLRANKHHYHKCQLNAINYILKRERPKLKAPISSIQCTMFGCTNKASWHADGARTTSGFVNHCTYHKEYKLKIGTGLEYKLINRLDSTEHRTPITSDMVLDMAKIAVITTKDFN